MNALSVLKSFQNDFNQLLDKSIFGINHSIINLNDKIGGWCPEVDIVDQEDSYQVKSNLPGVDPDDLEIYLNNGLLNIKGKLESKKEYKNKSYIQCECSYGEFSRTFSLPDANDEEKIEAEFKDGVLNIHIPKIKAKSLKRIEIKK